MVSSIWRRSGVSGSGGGAYFVFLFSICVSMSFHSFAGMIYKGYYQFKLLKIMTVARIQIETAAAGMHLRHFPTTKQEETEANN